ncbi:MAG: hypothetical protein NUV53_01175 [Patescibacteria group bacterium]|nr:hypothetical protein [Patescibacteria group bacterium]
MSFDQAIAAWQKREPTKPPLTLPTRLRAVVVWMAANTKFAQGVKRNQTTRELALLMRDYFRAFALMVAQYPRRSVALGIAINYPPGSCTRCGKDRCKCPPGLKTKILDQEINPEWLKESIYSVQTRMRKLYHAANMLNGGWWNMLARYYLEVHEAFDEDLAEMAESLRLLTEGDNSQLNGDPDERQSEESLIKKNIEFGDLMIWLAVVANMLDIPLNKVADPEWDMTSFVFADEIKLAQGEFEISDQSLSV